MLAAPFVLLVIITVPLCDSHDVDLHHDFLGSSITGRHPASPGYQ